MVEERTTTTDGEGTVHTTIIDDRPRSGGSGLLIALVLVIAAIAGFYLYSRSSGNEAIKDNAVAEAAKDVGNAAQQVGNAAEDAAKDIKKN